MFDLKIVILTRNRPQFIIDCIYSVLESSKKLPLNLKYLIEISDNSDFDDSYKLIKEEFNWIQLINRKPCLSVMEHFRIVFSEINSKYFVLFHDDDLMEPNYLFHLYSILSKNENYAAVGCNGFFMNNGIKLNQTFLNNNVPYSIIKNVKHLIYNYYGNLNRMYIAPFPGYMYNSSFFKKINLDILGLGKHSDVAILCELLETGYIYWTHECLITYRLHDNNDSKKFEIMDSLNLFFYLRFKNKFKFSKSLLNFRYNIWLDWIKNNKNLNDSKYKIISKFLFNSKLYFLLFDLNFKTDLLKRLKNKLMKIRR